MMYEVKRLAVVGAVSLSLLTGACAGRTGNPVMVNQYGDGKMSCERLNHEIKSIAGEMQRLLPKTDKTAKNAAFGAAGLFFIPLWAFMDFKNGELVEYEALRQRYNHLTGIAVEKNCGGKHTEYPTVAELKDMAEKAKKEHEAKASAEMFEEDQFSD